MVRLQRQPGTDIVEMNDRGASDVRSAVAERISPVVKDVETEHDCGSSARQIDQSAPATRRISTLISRP